MAIDVRVAREKTCPYAVASDLSSRDIPPLKIVIDQSVKGTQGTYDIKAPNGEIVVGTDDLTGALYPSDGTIMPAAGPFSYSRWCSLRPHRQHWHGTNSVWYIEDGDISLTVTAQDWQVSPTAKVVADAATTVLSAEWLCGVLTARLRISAPGGTRLVDCMYL